MAAESPAGLILEIDIRQLLAVVVAHHKTGLLFFDGPGWWEAAGHRRRSAAKLLERDEARRIAANAIAEVIGVNTESAYKP